MIYTAGYYGRNLEEFKETVWRLGAMVVDIRLVPQSRFFPDWRKANLERVFGKEYRHVPELGNKGFKEKRIEIADMKSGVEIIDELYNKPFVGVQSLVLLCACKSYQTCHRKTVAEELEKYAYLVEELE